LAYTRVDGYLRTWVFIWLCVRTAAAVDHAAVGDIMIMIYDPVIHTAVSLYMGGLTPIYQGAT